MWLGVASQCNYVAISSNLTTMSNLLVTGKTTLSNLTVGVGGEIDQGALNVTGILTSATLSNTGTLSNAGVAVFGGNLGVGTSAPAYPLDVVGNINCSGSISAGNLGMFRNRIINGDLRIAQRGSGAVGDGYGLDRWFIGSTVSSTFQQATLSTQYDLVVMNQGYTNCLLLTNKPGGATAFGQHIELCNAFDLLTSSVTVSFWVKSSVIGSINVNIGGSSNGIGGGMTYLSKTIQIVSANTWQYCKATFAPTLSSPSTGSLTSYGMHFYINGFSSDAQLCYTGIQLEKGTMATPFEFRPFSLELQLCMRYFRKLNLVNLGIALNAADGYNSSILLSPQMRATPSLDSKIANTYEVNNGSTGTVALRNIAGLRSTIDSVWFYNSDANWTPGATAIVVNCGLAAEL